MCLQLDRKFSDAAQVFYGRSPRFLAQYNSQVDFQSRIDRMFSLQISLPSENDILVNVLSQLRAVRFDFSPAAYQRYVLAYTDNLSLLRPMAHHRLSIPWSGRLIINVQQQQGTVANITWNPRVSWSRVFDSVLFVEGRFEGIDPRIEDELEQVLSSLLRFDFAITLHASHASTEQLVLVATGLSGAVLYETTVGPHDRPLPLLRSIFAGEMPGADVRNKRVALDAGAYSLDEFIQFYGQERGAWMWEHALLVPCGRLKIMVPSGRLLAEDGVALLRSVPSADPFPTKKNGWDMDKITVLIQR